jgi:hypothetical protein
MLVVDVLLLKLSSVNLVARVVFGNVMSEALRAVMSAIQRSVS